MFGLRVFIVSLLKGVEALTNTVTFHAKHTESKLQSCGRGLDVDRMLAWHA